MFYSQVLKYAVRRGSVFAAVSLFFTLVMAASLSASCGGLSCPMDAGPKQTLEPGVLFMEYNYQYIDQNEARIGTDKASIGQIRGHHDELYTLSRVQSVRLMTALSSRFGVEASVPFVHREHQHIHHHRGKDLLESWNFNGIGDLTLLTRFTFLKPGSAALPSLSLIFGGKLPTGKSDARGTAQQDTNLLASERAEAGIQPGTGAYDLIAGFSGLQSFSVPTLRDGTGRLPLFFEVTGRFTGKGRDDYRLGNTLLAGVGAVWPLSEKLGISGQINARYGRKDEKGTTSEEIDKTGGVWVYASPGFELNVTGDFGAYARLQVPVYQNVHGIQSVSTYNLLMGATYRFRMF